MGHAIRGQVFCQRSVQSLRTILSRGDNEEWSLAIVSDRRGQQWLGSSRKIGDCGNGALIERFERLGKWPV
jgi:hypothetical protein